MILNSPYISGSLTVTGNTTLQGALTVTGSLSGTASTASFALTLGGTGSVGFATTGAFAATSGSASSRLTQIEQVYATTGSNSFRATQSITGSLTVTGQIIAQTLNVQQVTSSIVYSSGSNVFGCDINSRQTFTGSFYQTGSVASFSNCVGVGTSTPGYILDVYNSVESNLRIKTCNTSGLSGLYIGNGNRDYSVLTRNSAGNVLEFRNETANSTAMTISGSCVGIGTTTPGSTLDVNGTFNVCTSTGSQISIIAYGGSSAKIRGSKSTLGLEACGALTLETNGPNERLRLDANGVACFSSAVCVGGNLVINGGSINVNCDATTATDARINFYTNNAVNGDRISLYGYNLAATTAGCEITYQALGYCCTNNQGYINFQTKSGGAWCNTMTIVNGRIGIGNTNPLFKVDICSNSSATTVKIKNASASGTTSLILNPEGAGAGSTGDGVIFFDMNSTAWVAGVDKSDSSKFKIANDVYGDFTGCVYFTVQTNGLTLIPQGLRLGSSSGTLNYYEEGTFTPYFCSAGLSGITYGSGQTGYYTRVGRLVFISINIMTEALTSSGTNNAVTIRCLPFTSANVSEGVVGLVITDNSRYSSTPPINASIGQNASFVYLYTTLGSTGPGTDPTPLYNQSFSNGAGNRNITRLSGVYITSS